MASQVILERSKEFSQSNNGIEFNPPDISNILQSQSINDTKLFFDILQKENFKFNLYNYINHIENT